ncbi:MAG TPA: helix-turn-helix transcriptional regulator [Solirubrobacterales bacterium]|nr:helix-turn-helix transcriptional regulator [Solirubrobacterales bacterium]
MSTLPLHEDPERLSHAFGRRMRELRAREGVSQDGLARESDVHPTSIGRLERGGREPRLSTILRIAEGLGVEPGELVNQLEGKGRRKAAGGD